MAIFGHLILNVSGFGGWYRSTLSLWQSIRKGELTLLAQGQVLHFCLKSFISLTQEKNSNLMCVQGLINWLWRFVKILALPLRCPKIYIYKMITVICHKKIIHINMIFKKMFLNGRVFIVNMMIFISVKYHWCLVWSLLSISVNIWWIHFLYGFNAYILEICLLDL